MNIDWPAVRKTAPAANYITIDKYGVIMAHSSEPKYADVSGTWSSGLFPSPVKLGMMPVGSDFIPSSAIHYAPGHEPKPVVMPEAKPVDEHEQFLNAQKMIAQRTGDEAKLDRLTQIATGISQEASAKNTTVPTMAFTVDPTTPAPKQFALAVVQFCEAVAQSNSSANIKPALDRLRLLAEKL